MRKLLIMSAAVLAFSATHALAESTAPADKPAGHHGGGFLELDTDGDGLISKSEFLAKQEKRFSEMDANGDGNVTPEEGKAAREAWRAKMKEKRAMMKKEREQRQSEAPAKSDAPVKSDEAAGE